MHQIVGFDIGIKNLAYCIIESSSHSPVEIKYLEKMDLKCQRQDHQKIIDAMIDILDDILFQKLRLDCPIIVLIEVQMTSIMKCIQTVVNTFFKMNAKYQALNIQTKYVSPKHKMNLIGKYCKEQSLDFTFQSSQYKQNKYDAVKFAEWMLENKYKDANILQRLRTSKKFDDEMDCFLMSVYFIENCLSTL